MSTIDAAVIDWLLEGDPAIRYQTRRDLLDSDAGSAAAEQARIAEEGWGARLLGLRAPDGRWGGGNYSPKFISTHYTLLGLMRLGLAPGHPQALRACEQLINNEGMLFNLGEGFPTWPRIQPDICVLGMTLAMLAYFGLAEPRVHRLAAYIVEKQMADKGWNCRHWRGDTHSSFHSTCSVMEGLLEYQKAYPDSELPLAEAQAGGREFLLVHHLYKSHRSGEVVNEAMTRFPFPPQWQYDFLKALDYFQAAGAPRDERASDAIDLLLSRRDAEGRWAQYRGPAGKYHFQIEPVGKAGRGNTLRALRVLKWWNAG